MGDSYTFKEKEIREITSSIENEYRLQVYKNLKNIRLSSKVTKKEIEKFKKDVIDIFKIEKLPRLLTEEEIDDITSVIPLAPATLKDIALDNRRQIREAIETRLSKFRLIVNENTIGEIKEYLLDKYYKSSSQAGDSVGVISSMSIGQPLTQANLNTFHNTGTKNSSNEGLKFVEKLLNLSETKDVDSIKNIIHFKDKNKTREEIYNIGKKIKGITIEKLIKPNCKIIMNKIDNKDKIWYKNYIKIMKVDYNILKKDYPFLRIFIDTDKLYKYDLTLEDVIQIIKKHNKVPGFKETIVCIGSNSFLGIIDIYTVEEYARKKIKDFSLKIDKDSNIVIGDIKEQINVFLKSILANDFKYMYLKGIKGVANFSICEPVAVVSTFKEISIINARDLSKFSKAPYNLVLKDIDYLWQVRITKYYIHLMGLNDEKYIKLFTEAGLKIIENNFNTTNPHFIVLMPKDRLVKYLDEKTGKSYTRYSLSEDGRYYDNKDKAWSLNYSPKKLIQEKLNYIRELLIYQTEKRLEENVINDIGLHFDPLYRYANYFYATIEGDNIISELYSIKEIDFSYSYPDDIHRVNKLFGIEAARFNISSKYNSGKSMENINPMNIELLIDFQTAYGFPVSVSSNTLAQQGNSILTSASFQSSLDYIFRGSAFGEVDEIKGISSCIMTGSKSRNGTGIVDCTFSEDYLNDENNLLPKDIDFKDDYPMLTSSFSGPCYSAGELDNILDDINPESKVSDDKDLEPPRMEVPTEIEDLLDLEDILYSKDEEINNSGKTNTLDDVFQNLDIPSAPLGNIPDDLF